MSSALKWKLLGFTALGWALVTMPGAPALADDTSQGAVETVTVTGSRLHQDEYTSTDPVQVITTDDAILKGISDIAGMLRESSVVAGSYQQTTGLANMPTTGGQGSQTVSLRGLSPQRTLVLLNGRRAGPAGVSGSVSAFDLNTIPQAAVERIEILKDGASSIYGSDAVAGVVNIITRKDVEGGTVDAFSTEPFQSGGRQYHISGSYGWVFDKGYLNVSGEYDVQQMLHTGDRSYLSCQRDLVTDASGQSLDVIDNVTGKPKCYELGGFPGYVHGAYVVGPGYLQYDPTNQFGPYDANAANPYSGIGYRKVQIAGDPGSYAPLQSDDKFFNRRSAELGLDVDTVFAQGGYDISPGVEAYSEFLWNRRNAKSDFLATLSFPIAATQASNPFGATAYPAAVVPSDGNDLVDYTRAVGGFRGTLHGGLLDAWDWDLSATVSRSYGTYAGFSILQDAVNYEDGSAANGECGVAGVTETPISHEACPTTPVNWFGPNIIGDAPAKFTDAEKAYLFHESVGHTKYNQDVFEGSMTGTAFTLPAGPVSTAVGFQFRDDSIDDEPDAEAQAFNQTFLNAAKTKGSDASREAFAEVGIPILANVDFAQNLDVDLSARYVDYNSSGSNTTWKAGINWRPFDWLRFHATQGTSFRAPALFEQFQGAATIGYPQTLGFDPCLNWQLNTNATIQHNCQLAGVPSGLSPANAVAALETRGGSPNAKPETSRSTTVGFVLTPDFLDFNLAVDYWEINVANELSYYNSNQVALCYESTSYPTDPLCSLFHRSATTHYVDTIDDHYVNISDQRERGIDISAQVHQDFGWVDVVANTQWTVKLEDNSTLFAGAPETNRFDRVGYPAIVGNGNLRFTRDGWTFNWGVDFYGHASDQKYVATSSTTDPHVLPGTTVFYKDYTEAVLYHTFSLSYSYDRWSAEIGVANAFDQHPPELSSNEISRRGISALPDYDLVGRRAFADLKIKF